MTQLRNLYTAILFLLIVSILEGLYIFNIKSQIEHFNEDIARREWREEQLKKEAEKEKQKSDSLQVLAKKQDSIIAQKRKSIPIIIHEKNKAINHVISLNTDSTISLLSECLSSKGHNRQ